MLDCLHTTVVNTGNSRPIGYLGKHGRFLEAGDQYSVPGNIIDQLAARASKRHFESLQRDLTAGVIVIVKTPEVLMYDATNDETKALTLDAGTLGITDPCSGQYSSSV